MDFLKKSSTRSYSQEDVQEIMNIALANHATTNAELSHSQLLEIAQELDISPDSIELAKIGGSIGNKQLSNINSSISIANRSYKIDLVNMRSLMPV